MAKVSNKNCIACFVICIFSEHKHYYCHIFATEIQGLTKDSNLKEYKHECNE